MAVVLARLGTAKITAILSGAVFVALLAFLFWGGPPSENR
jgi:hypothetical protein